MRFLPILLLPPSCRPVRSLPRPRPPMPTPIAEIIAHGVVIVTPDLEIDVPSSRTARSRRSAGASTGVWRIDGDKLCSTPNETLIEDCAVYPAGKKSGDTFDLDAPGTRRVHGADSLGWPEQPRRRQCEAGAGTPARRDHPRDAVPAAPAAIWVLAAPGACERGMTIEEGTLYPLLRRLEGQGLLASEWRIEDGPPRRYYTLSPQGEAMLRQSHAELARPCRHRRRPDRRRTGHQEEEGCAMSALRKPDALIEAYVLDVMKRLPRSMRNDVGYRTARASEPKSCAVAPPMRAACRMKRWRWIAASRFGNPDDVAARYHPPGVPIIPRQRDTRLCLGDVDRRRPAMGGDAADGAGSSGDIQLDRRWWVTYGLGAFWWPGFLVTITHDRSVHPPALAGGGGLEAADGRSRSHQPAAVRAGHRGRAWRHRALGCAGVVGEQ